MVESPGNEARFAIVQSRSQEGLGTRLGSQSRVVSRLGDVAGGGGGDLCGSRDRLLPAVLLPQRTTPRPQLRAPEVPRRKGEYVHDNMYIWRRAGAARGASMHGRWWAGLGAWGEGLQLSHPQAEQPTTTVSVDRMRLVNVFGVLSDFTTTLWIDWSKIVKVQISIYL